MKVVNILIAASLAVLIALVLIRLFRPDGFRNNAEKWARPSFDQSNEITLSALNNLQGDKLLVNLSEKGDQISDLKGIINIPVSSVLEKENLKKLRGQKGNIVLISEDPAISVRIWMLLSQMGIKNLYILIPEAAFGDAQNKFLPDTLAGSN